MTRQPVPWIHYAQLEVRDILTKALLISFFGFGRVYSVY